jgi:uncharacterized membrane protein YbhN (UPF0104 family)
MSPAASDTTSTPRKRRAFLWRGLQVVVTLCAFAYLYATVDRAALLRAASAVSAGTFLLCIAMGYLGYAFAVVRWRLLLRAFAAPAAPPLRRLAKYYLIGAFYNTYLPGGVGGDVVRGLASRDAFGPDGVTSALAVVLVERVMGMSALLLLTAAATFVHPLPGIAAPWLFASIGVLASSSAVLGLMLARRLSMVMPAPLSGWLVRLPVPANFGSLLAALPLSVACQVFPALAGHVLIAELSAAAHPMDSLVIIPLALSAAFLPFTLSGAGVREAIFVRLYALVGVPSSAALAASLGLWFSQAIVAASGGVWSLLRPLTDGRDEA